MSILVTGGAGYVGSAVAQALVAAGHSVVVFDNFSRGHREALPAGVDLVVGDLADASALEALFAGRSIDACMHFAALIEAGESMQVPERYFRNNTAHTMNLLEALLRHRVERFVFSSTAALYGDPERIPIRESDRLQPASAYGESKLLVERILAWYHAIHGLRYASLRYFNAAGATPGRGEDHHPESHLIPLTLQVALGRRDRIRIFGAHYPTEDGTCVRDYVHVADLADAHLLALDALPAASAPLIYNVGSGRGFSVRQVVEVARQVTGHAIPAPEAPRRPGDPAVLVASSDKIREELGWRPRFPDLEAIVASAWDWHRSHPAGYGDAVAAGRA